MAEQPSKDRRTSARLKVKEDLFTTDGPQSLKQNGAVKQTKGSGKGKAALKPKRKPDYDEDDDGFKFTRAKPKRAKITPTVSHEESVPPSEALPEEKSTPRRRTGRKSQEPDPKPRDEPDDRVATRQSPRKSHGIRDQEWAPEQDLSIHQASPRDRERKQKAASQHDEALRSRPIEQPNEPTKIALPFADTPIIRRNKEMRKGNNESRRSSLSMRGRRASSLIDSGTSSALPHDQVETVDFYKHIESSLLEPRRMRQLLMWCGSRALGDKPSFATEDSDVRLAARQIQQELLKDFSSKAELSDWFSREDSPAQPKALRPNPRNIANLAKIDELEQKLRSLRAEHERWLQLQKAPAPEALKIDTLRPIGELTLSTVPRTAVSSLPGLQDLVSIPNPSATDLTTNLQRNLEQVTSKFQLNLDKLLDSVNSLGQHLQDAEGLSKRVLSSVAAVLEEKDKKAVEKEGSVGARDTLRALTRLMDRG